MSLGYLSEPLCGKPDDTTSKAQVALNSVFPTGEWQYKIPTYISEITDTRGALTSIRVSATIGSTDYLVCLALSPDVQFVCRPLSRRHHPQVNAHARSSNL